MADEVVDDPVAAVVAALAAAAGVADDAAAVVGPAARADSEADAAAHVVGDADVAAVADVADQDALDDDEPLPDVHSARWSNAERRRDAS